MLSAVWIVILVAVGGAFVLGYTPPLPKWTLIHVVTVGVLSTGIVHWSWYFSRALLRRGAHTRAAVRGMYIRSGLTQGAFLMLIAGMWSATLVLTLLALLVYGAVIVWHIGTLLGRNALRGATPPRTSPPSGSTLASDPSPGSLALGSVGGPSAGLLSRAGGHFASPYASLVRFYIAASVFFLIAAVLVVGSVSDMSGWVANQSSSWQWVASSRDYSAVAHFVAGVHGWLGLTIGGTVVTFVPTMLRTRMRPEAARWALRVFPVWCVGILVAIVGALGVAIPPIHEWLTRQPAGGVCSVTCGVAVGSWLVAVAWLAGIMLPAGRVITAERLREFPGLSATVGLVWLSAACVAWALWATIAPDFSTLRAGMLQFLPSVAAGGMMPLFLGSLTYLLPVACGGGPQAVGAAVAVGNRLATVRVMVRQIAALVMVACVIQGAQASGGVLRAVWMIIAAVTLWDVATIGASIVANRRAPTP